MDFKITITKVGDYVAGLTQKVINFLDSKGIFTSSLTAKLITILIILSGIFVVIKFLNALSKPMKYVIIAILAFLIFSILFTFI